MEDQHGQLKGRITKTSFGIISQQYHQDIPHPEDKKIHITFSLIKIDNVKDNSKPYKLDERVKDLKEEPTTETEAFKYGHITEEPECKIE